MEIRNLQLLANDIANSLDDLYTLGDIRQEMNESAEIEDFVEILKKKRPFSERTVINLD